MYSNIAKRINSGLEEHLKRIMVFGPDGRTYIVEDTPTWNVTNKRFQLWNLMRTELFGEFKTPEAIEQYLNETSTKKYKIYYKVLQGIRYEVWPGVNEEDAIQRFLKDAEDDFMTRERIMSVEVQKGV